MKFLGLHSFSGFSHFQQTSQRELSLQNFLTLTTQHTPMFICVISELRTQHTPMFICVILTNQHTPMFIYVISEL